MKKLAAILFALLTFSCCNNEEKAPTVSKTFNKFFNNGEVAGCWININTLKEGNAFSGKNSCQMDSITEFGLGFREEISKVGDGIPSKVIINAMVMRPTEDIDATIVVSVDRGDKNIFWLGSGLKALLSKSGEWSKITAKINLPKDIESKDKISIYLWNDKKQKVLMDDFEVSFE